MRSLLFFLTLIVGLSVLPAGFPLVGSGTAKAQDDTAARLYFDRGNEHLSRGLRSRGQRRQAALQDALEAYLTSLQIARSPSVVFNAGLALEALGRFDAAFNYFTEYVGADGLTDEDRAEGEAKRDGIRPNVAVVGVTSTPAGAEVRIDRADVAPVGLAPIEIAIPEGDRTVHVALSGYRPFTEQITARRGTANAVHASLELAPVTITIRAPAGGRVTVDGREVRANEPIEVMPGQRVIRYEPSQEQVVEISAGSDGQEIQLGGGGSSGPVPESGGTLAISLNRPGTVTVDGVVVGDGAAVETDLGAGRHFVTVEADGFATASSQVEITPGRRVELEGTLGENSGAGALPAVLWVTAGVVGIAAIGMAVGAYQTNLDLDEAVNANAPFSQRQDMAQEVDTLNLVADVLGGTAVGIAAVALITTLLSGGEGESTLRLEGAVTADGAHVGVRGQL